MTEYIVPRARPALRNRTLARRTGCCATSLCRPFFLDRAGAPTGSLTRKERSPFRQPQRAHRRLDPRKRRFDEPVASFAIRGRRRSHRTYLDHRGAAVRSARFSVPHCRSLAQLGEAEFETITTSRHPSRRSRDTSIRLCTRRTIESTSSHEIARRVASPARIAAPSSSRAASTQRPAVARWMP